METQTRVPASDDDGNAVDEVNHGVNDAIESPRDELRGEEAAGNAEEFDVAGRDAGEAEADADHDNDTTGADTDTDVEVDADSDVDDDDDDDSVEAFPAEKPVAKVLSRAGIPSNAGKLNQRRIDVRW